MNKSGSPLRDALDLHTAETYSAAEQPIEVGVRLRALREARRFSIKALAEASGLAVNTLSLIEHGKSSPSVSTLQQIATALHVPIMAFFTPEAPRSRVVYHPVGQVVTLPFPYGGLADLGVGMARRSIEPLRLSLDPGAGSGPETIMHTGQEFVYGLEGVINYTVAGQVYLIEPGASLLFEATLPHCWHNPSPTLAVALLVLCPYDAPGAPSAHHELYGAE